MIGTSLDLALSLVACCFRYDEDTEDVQCKDVPHEISSRVYFVPFAQFAIFSNFGKTSKTSLGDATTPPFKTNYHPIMCVVFSSTPTVAIVARTERLREEPPRTKSSRRLPAAATSRELARAISTRAHALLLRSAIGLASPRTCIR